MSATTGTLVKNLDGQADSVPKSIRYVQYSDQMQNGPPRFLERNKRRLCRSGQFVVSGRGPGSDFVIEGAFARLDSAGLTLPLQVVRDLGEIEGTALVRHYSGEIEYVLRMSPIPILLLK